MKRFTLTSLASLAAIGLAVAASASSASKETATIKADPTVLTMVNVITPAAGKQDETLAKLQAGMDQEISRQPGFVSASVHRSLDSEHIAVYAQWKDQASVDKAVKLIQSGGAPNMLAVFSSSKPNFHPYEVKSIHLAK